MAIAVIVSVASAAQAQEPPAEGGEKGEAKPESGRLPVSFVERPLTLPRLVLSPSLGFDVTHCRDLRGRVQRFRDRRRPQRQRGLRDYGRLRASEHLLAARANAGAREVRGPDIPSDLPLRER